MLWFLGNLVVSPSLRDYILGHYEPDLRPSEIPRGFIWVANSTIEVLGRATLVVGLMAFASVLVSYLAYRTAKNP